MNTKRPSPGWRQLSLVPQLGETQLSLTSRLAYPISLVMKAHGKDRAVPTHSAVVGVGGDNNSHTSDNQTARRASIRRNR